MVIADGYLCCMKISNSVAIFAAVLLVGCFACTSSVKVSEDQLNQGTWSELKSSDGSLPVERHEAAFVGVKDKMYLLGGRGMKPVSIYDAKNNTWTNGATVPVEMHHFQPIVYDDKIYIMGAMTGGYPGETPVPEIHIYDPATDKWSVGDVIPEERRRGGAGSVLHNGKMYLACGIKDGHRGDHKKWLDVYDPKTGEWGTLPDAPRARDHFQVAVVDNKLYAVGGRTTRSATNPFANTMTEVDVFDFETNQWTTLAKGLPTPRAGNYLMVLGKHILVLGGESFYQEPAHSEVEVLNTSDGSWSALQEIPQGRHGTGAVWWKGDLYTSSGSGNRGGGPELPDLWKFDVL